MHGNRIAFTSAAALLLLAAGAAGAPALATGDPTSGIALGAELGRPFALESAWSSPRLIAGPLLPAPLNHGPGTSGGGSEVVSGETLRAGRLALTLRTGLTGFDAVSAEEAEALALDNDEFDSIERTWVQTVNLEYGLTDDLQLGAELGYYAGTDFLSAEADGLGGAESATADPCGLTDLWLRAKWRFSHGPAGHLALLGGVKLPTGKDDERLSNGELLEASSQPGTGAVDFQFGLAYSRYLNERTTLDASGLYLVRGSHEGFTVGDRADVGVALAYRLTEDVAAPRNWSVFGELDGVWIGKDDEEGVSSEGTGGTTIYLAAGVRNRLNSHWAISVAPSVPISQDLNGSQVETDWKLAVTLTVTP